MRLFSNIKLALAEVKRYERSERSFIYLCCLIWANVVLQYFYAAILHIGPISFLSTWIEPIIVTLLIIGAIPYFVKKIHGITYTVYILILFVYLISYILYTDNYDALNHYYYRFLTALPMIFIGQMINVSKIDKAFFYISVLNIFSTGLYYLVYTQSMSYSGNVVIEGDSHEMVAAYNILPHVLFVMYKTFTRVTKLNLFTSVLGFILVSSFGTRGPFMCVVLFMGIYMVMLKEFKRPFVAKASILLITTVIIMNISHIMFFMSAIVSSLGMSDRIFQIFLDGNFIGGEASGDERLYFVDVLESILQNSTNFFGYGIAGAERFINSYPHNLLLELRFSFGNILGTFLMGIIIIMIYNKYKQDRIESDRVFLIILVICSIVKLFMSGTFIVDSFFYFLLGYCLNKTNKQGIETN